MRVLEKEVNMLLDKEAKMWAQQSKVLWLKDGDRNTRLFHSKASQPQRHNYITKLHDTLGRLCTRPSQINDIITTFYQELFTTGGSSSFEEVIDTIPQVVSPEMNAKLIADFTIDEVEAVIRQMAPLKAPGLDDMPSLFYHNFWSLIGSDVSLSILHYLNTRVLPQSLGHYFITLIPGVKNPEYVTEFHPISLSNVLYRIFAMVLSTI